MNKRGFLQACLAAATAPWVVTSAGVLMPVRELISWRGMILMQTSIYPIQSALSPQWYQWFRSIDVAMAEQSGWTIASLPITKLMQGVRSE